MKFSRRGMVKKYSQTPQQAMAELNPHYRGIIDNGDIQTGVGIMADKADDIGSPLANLYRAMFEQGPQREQWRNRLPEGYSTAGMLYHGGHISHWVKDAPDKYGYSRQHQVVHQFAPMTDGNVWATLHLTRNDAPGTPLHSGAVIGPQEAEEYMHHLSGSGGKWYWATGDQERGRREEVQNPVTHLRNGLQATTGTTQPAQLSRTLSFKKVRRYAEKPYEVGVRKVISPQQQPEGARWMKPTGKGADKTWKTQKVNENLQHVLAGSRLAVVLHEIKDKFGGHDPELEKLADMGLSGVFRHEGQDTYEQIRNRLLEHAKPISARLGLGKRNAERAGELARNYNWHRVTSGLRLDHIVSEFLHGAASQKLKDRGIVYRSAHHIFGNGSGENARKADEGQRQNFMASLMSHVRDTHKVTGVNEQHLLKSLERLAGNEGAVERIGKGLNNEPTGPLHSQTVGARNPLKPAWSSTKSGVKVAPGIEAAQFRRAQLKIKYGVGEQIRNLFGGSVVSNPIRGIRHTSHPRGEYDPSAHLAVNTEMNGVLQTLRALNYIPPKTPTEDRSQYDNDVQRLVRFFTDKLRDHVSQNVADPHVENYIRKANQIAAPDTETTEKGERPRLDPLPISAVGLSTALAPLVKRVAEQHGVRPVTERPRPLLQNYPVLPPAPGESQEQLIDLSDPATQEDYAASILHGLDAEGQKGGMVGRSGFGKGTPIHADTPSTETVPEDWAPQLPKVGGRVGSLPRQPFAPLADKGKAYQDIANHLANKGTRESAIQLLQDMHGLDKRSAGHHFEQYLKSPNKPQGKKEVGNNPMTGSVGKGIRRKKTFMRQTPIKYSHEAFQNRAREEPSDSTNRKVYADWLEDYAPNTVHPDTLNFLRTHEGNAWISRHPETGEVKAGPHYSWEDIRKANGETSHFNEMFPNENHGWFNGSGQGGQQNSPHGEPHSGPGGTYFVTERGDPLYGEHSYNTWQFHPDTGGISWQEARHGSSDKSQEVHADAHQMSQTHPPTPQKPSGLEPREVDENVNFSRLSILRRYGAYRAPAGGMIARGTHYRGGEMIPDMQSDFMNPPTQPVKMTNAEGGIEGTGPEVQHTPVKGMGEEAGKVRRWKFDSARLAKIRAKLGKIST